MNVRRSKLYPRFYPQLDRSNALNRPRRTGFFRGSGTDLGTIAYLRASVGRANQYGISLGYWICSRGGDAAPLESTTIFMFVLIANALTMAGVGEALWPEGRKEE